MTTMTLYCECQTPIMDVEHDAGCRRCSRPVDFSPIAPNLSPDAIAENSSRPSASRSGDR